LYRVTQEIAQEVRKSTGRSLKFESTLTTSAYYKWALNMRAAKQHP